MDMEWFRRVQPPVASLKQLVLVRIRTRIQPLAECQDFDTTRLWEMGSQMKRPWSAWEAKSIIASIK